MFNNLCKEIKSYYNIIYLSTYEIMSPALIFPLWIKLIYQTTCFGVTISMSMDMYVKVAQSCPTLWNLVDYTVHGIL